jgi:nucleoid DNA-binding protein
LHKDTTFLRVSKNVDNFYENQKEHHYEKLIFAMMKKIGLYIEKLLAKHHYVVIPDLGGFVVQPQQAVILPGKIIPPRFCVSFNSLLSHSDGLLAIEMSKTEHISYRQAAAYIENAVAAVKEELKQNGISQIGNIGALHKIKGEQLLFTPSANASFLPENLGLTEIYYREKIHPVNSGVNRIPIRPTKKVFRYAAAAALLIALSWFSPNMSFDRETNLQADFLSLSFMFNTPENKFSEEQQYIEEVFDAQDISIASHHVIVAGLRTEKAAERFCKKLINSDYSGAHILPPLKLYYKVAIASFSTREDALDYAKVVRSQSPDFKEAWVFSE